MLNISKLMTSINEKLEGTGYRALVGGSTVLKFHGLLDRKLEDVDIIITKGWLQTDESEKIVEKIKELFPMDCFYSASVDYPTADDENKKDKYFWNEKVDVYVGVMLGFVNTINFMMHTDTCDEHYSNNTYNNLPIVSVDKILAAKRSYNRPKDILDFHEMQKKMFF